MIPVIVVEGPTASGKTALGVQLAKAAGGEVVSADSMQIYQFMEIGSAAPTAAEMQGVPHHLIGVIPPVQDFSLAQYAALAREKIADIHSRGKIPVLVGGTGLYIDTVLKNITLSETNQDPRLRERLKRLAQAEGAEALFARLRQVDPDSAARLHPNDLKRVIRALELYETTGETMTEHIRRSRRAPSPYRAVQFGIWYEREELYRRINQRVDNMLDQGLVEEVRRLVHMGCTRQNTSMQGIGYKEVLDFLEGKCTYPEMTEKIKMESRRYAKRQLSWFRRSPIHWLAPGETVQIWDYLNESGETT